VPKQLRQRCGWLLSERQLQVTPAHHAASEEAILRITALPVQSQLLPARVAG